VNYRADIDGLRAVAVIPVVLFHARLAGFTGGYVGVDVFFVISGYLITGILLDDLRADRFSILRFYERRIRRIFPALFVTLLVCLAAATATMLPRDLARLGRSVVAVTLFASNILFARQGGYFDGPLEEDPLLHTWSLAVEEQFYIVFPLYLFLLWRFLRAGRAAVTLGVMALSFAVSVWQVQTTMTDAFFLAPARAWELLLGSCLAMGVVPAAPPTFAPILPGVGLAMIAWSVFAYTAATPFPGAAAALPCLGAALIIHAGGGAGSWARRLLSWGPLVFVGKISYSLYLIHWPILVLGAYCLIRPSPAETTALVLLASVLATASWHYVEGPFRGRGSNLTRRRLFAGGALVMAVTGALGAALYMGKGLPGRIRADVQQLAAASTDRSKRALECSRGAADIAGREPCSVGSSDAHQPSFLVWGDSHALSLFDVVDRTAADAGQRGLFVASTGCPPLFEVGQAQRPEYDAPCLAVGRAVDGILASRPSVETVVLVSRWAIYARGERYGAESGPLVYIKDQKSTVASLGENRLVFERGLQRTIDRVRARGKRVVIVAQVPEVGLDVPSTLARARMFGASLDLEPTLADYTRRQDFVLRSFREAERQDGVDVLYPHEYLCPGGRCRVTDAGGALYFDSNHLSVHGASLLAAMLEPIFRAVPALPGHLASLASQP
jgi:peptidoglycan/LPS O-acetylase OafA/YrhL